MSRQDPTTWIVTAWTVWCLLVTVIIFFVAIGGVYLCYVYLSGWLFWICAAASVVVAVTAGMQRAHCLVPRDVPYFFSLQTPEVEPPRAKPEASGI